jgi:hypothetical protein
VTLGWCCGIIVYSTLTLRAYLATGEIPLVLAGLAFTSVVLAGLLAVGSKWGLLLQVLGLIPGVVLFPLTLVAIILLGYMTRPETVSYFDQRVEGPRWDHATSWFKGEWPWLVALGLAGGVCVLFMGVLAQMLRRFPNL